MTRATKLNSRFLKEVEETIQKVNPAAASENNIQDLPTSQRESVGVANRLSQRLASLHKNNDCPTCWLQRAHCVCHQTPPIDHLLPSNIHRLFIIMHHKEIGLVVDTAKILLNAFPSKARLVVSGIGAEYQESLVELMDALKKREGKEDGGRRCIVLFPTDDAKTFEELSNDASYCTESVSSDNSEATGQNEMFDVIVMDGTWSQARKIHSKYIPLEKDGGPQRVCLSQEALDVLGQVDIETTENSTDTERESRVINGIERGGNGRQLRRHPIKWKEVSTLEATRLLFRDMMIANTTSESSVGDDEKESKRSCHKILAEYQRISDTGAVKQLGPPREKK